jgi:hypothetical protein
MKPDQVHLVAAAVPRDAQQLVYAFESRLAGKVVRDVAHANRFD